MKVAIVSAVFLVLSLESVCSFPASAGSSWTQYLPAQRRAIGPEEDTNSITNGEPEYEADPNTDYINDGSSQTLGVSANPGLAQSPFNAFMFMKPLKPTFMPPLVDPQYFIDKKTAFLNNLFGGKVAGAPVMGPAPQPFWMTAAGSKAQEAKRAIADDGFAPLQAHLLMGPSSPWAFAPTVKPTIVPPSFWSPFAAGKAFGSASSPFAPSPVDPSVFASKKTEFLNKLFDSLNIPPKPTEAIPISVNPKPTIVPADFWAPPGVTDPATIYAQKVTEFLDKLFNSLSTANTAIGSAELLASLKREITDTKIADAISKVESQFDTKLEPLARRSSLASAQSTVEPSLLNAKDKIVDTIIAELAGVKNNMLITLEDLMKKQKEINSAAQAPAPGSMKKKPGSPFVSPYAAFWTPTAKPTTDPMEPFQTRIELLDQFFEMLTKLQKDVTLAVNEAVQESATTTTPSPPPVQNQTSLYEAIKNRIEQLANQTTNKVVAPVDNTRKAKFIRALKPMGMAPAPFLVEPNFWAPDPAAMGPVGPGFYADKTQQFLGKLFSNLAAGKLADDSSKTRSIKMAVHQGYQSLPPGSEETLQAGGGSVPQQHEGGGLKLQNVQESNAREENQNSAHRHHHHN